MKESVWAIPAERCFIWGGVDEDDRPLTEVEFQDGLAVALRQRPRTTVSAKTRKALRVDPSRDVFQNLPDAGQRKAPSGHKITLGGTFISPGFPIMAFCSMRCGCDGFAWRIGRCRRDRPWSPVVCPTWPGVRAGSGPDRCDRRWQRSSRSRPDC